ncbi:MAG: alanine racemase [Actinobacteria bacterium]|nr:alanine racemase [Actinomycetota bacterium]
MENRAEAIIDLSAIEKNVKHLMAHSSAPALAVVKANAYGHGLVAVARTAVKAGASWLGVALLEEALTLRAARIKAPILSWLTPISDDFAAAIKNNIDLAIPSVAHLKEVIAEAKSLQLTARVHLEVDTGMTRGGALYEWDELVAEAKKAEVAGVIKVVGVWSHFARADEPGHEFNDLQLSNFEKALEVAKQVGLNPEIKHMSNSAATLRNPKAKYDLVRLGIAMYGLSPDVNTMGDSKGLGLIPALTLRAKLHLVKDVPAGSKVGYGGTAEVKTDTKIGVVAMGYADGVPRNADSSAGVLVGNKMSPIIGRVSMDQFVVDLGKESQARAGDWAYLIGGVIGSDKGDSYTSDTCYTADSWAGACGTINYEIVTRIGPRVKRIYLD